MSDLATLLWLCAGATILFLVLRIALGATTKIVLVSQESRLEDQAVISVTPPFPSGSYLQKTFDRTKWPEVDLILRDYEGALYGFYVRYDPIRWYTGTLKGQGIALINGKPIQSDKKYFFRSGTMISIGGREFRVEIKSFRKYLQYRESIYRSDSA